jgi:hypothetical protein
MYANVMRAKLKAEHPLMSNGDLARTLTAQWQAMSQQEKQVRAHAQRGYG